MQGQTETDLLARFVADQKLPESYIATARRCFLPLAEELKAANARGELKVLGIVGSQGSGKSTLAGLLELVLSQIHGLRTASLSLDDFYLGRDARRQLAIEVHPLLATRGVPGTHDVQLAVRTIHALLSPSGEASIPRFDKARDDRRPPSGWDRVPAPVDLVILEGWCLNAPPQTSTQLTEPINTLEQEEDRDGRWRAYVNRCLENEYPHLFQLIDKLILLKAPSFDCVYAWRLQQEQKLATTAGNKIMSEQSLKRFVQHFERITQASLRTLPHTADLVFELDAEQGVTKRYDNTA